jgi:hypothetical protein
MGRIGLRSDVCMWELVFAGLIASVELVFPFSVLRPVSKVLKIYESEVAMEVEIEVFLSDVLVRTCNWGVLLF